MKTTTIALALAAGLSPLAVFAHATLEQGSAEEGSTYKAVVRIGHGCDGQPTLRLRVRIPEGMVSVKPMPKSGWTLDTVTADYAQIYDYHGPKSEGATEITWTGSLDDSHFDEFVFRGNLHADAFAAGDVVYFPVVQECADGEEAWVNVPEASQDSHDIDHPAPALRIVPGGHAHH
ncbi:MAG: DUF1775 domain-containing protein [Jannaschia sp.]